MTAKSDKANAARYLWLKKRFHTSADYFSPEPNRHWMSFMSRFSNLNTAIDREMKRKVK